MHFPDVLVLGATGRIGGILRSRWPEGRARWQGRGANDRSGDARALARAAGGCAAILCLAGVTPARVRAGRGVFADNTALACAAVRAGAQAGARVLLASSASVYGNCPGPLDEDTPLAPQSDYGRAKAVMEEHAAELGARLGVTVCALRIANIAGIDAILGGWHPGFRLDCFADGRTPRRSYIGPVTLARVLGDVAAAPDLPARLNIAAPGPVEMGALLDAAGLGWSPRIAAPEAIPEVYLSTRRLAQITPLRDTDSQPQALVAEWRSMGADKDPVTSS